MSSGKKRKEKNRIKKDNGKGYRDPIVSGAKKCFGKGNDSGVYQAYAFLYRAVFLFFVYGTGVVLPLYFRNGYYDMMEAKADLFFLMMKILLPFAVILLFLKIRLKKDHFSLFEKSLLLFLISVSISTLFSVSPENAFSGSQGWHVGYFSMICLIVVLLALKDETTFKNDLVYIPLLMVYGFETVMTFLDARGSDLLSLKAGLPQHYHYSYFATLGNSNWHVAYLSLFVPILVCLYLSSKKMIWTILSFLLNMSGLIASLLIGADGIFISILFSVILMMMFVLDNTDRIKRFLLLLSCFLIVCAAIGSSERFVVFFDYYEGMR